MKFVSDTVVAFITDRKDEPSHRQQRHEAGVLIVSFGRL
jgi:hypothetical protein